MDSNFKALGIALFTLSDTRTLETDHSGSHLAEGLEAAGHSIRIRQVLPDDLWQLRAALCAAVADDSVQVIITTGATGITGRDIAPEAMELLFDKSLPGFGELFRQLSFDDIGASTIQSRATAGLAGNTLLFALPGSTKACALALEKILIPQLDLRTKPCNFAMLLDRLGER